MKRLLIVTFAVTLLAGAASCAWLYHDLHKSIAHNKSGQYIEIPKGSSTAFVVKKLAAGHTIISSGHVGSNPHVRQPEKSSQEGRRS